MLIIVIKIIRISCEMNVKHHQPVDLLNVVPFNETRNKQKNVRQKGHSIKNRIEFAGRRGLHIRWQIRNACRLTWTDKWGKKNREREKERSNQSLQLTHLLHRFPLYAFLFYFYIFSFFGVVFLSSSLKYIFVIHVAWFGWLLACSLVILLQTTNG